MMTKCELCECSARMYCESDQASLCWDCDEKVHGANFLVAKHSRCLLCHVCQSLTPWKASGQNLGPTVSVCHACVAAARCGVSDDDDETVHRDNRTEGIGGGHNETDNEDDGDDSDDDEEEDLDEEEEEDENQVVPWSEDSQPPPPVSSPSCGSMSDVDVSLKRMRDFADLSSDDEIEWFSQPASNGAVTNEEATATTSLSSSRPSKQPRTTMPQQDHGQQDSRSTAIISSLQRLQNQMIKNDGPGDASATNTIIGICRLSRDKTR